MNFQKVARLVKAGDAFLLKNGSFHFHEKAPELLSEACLHESFDVQEVLKRVFAFKHEQNFKRLEFSDLPLTIARGEHCFIDVYFWRRRPTTVHNHHFTGAFQCLYGLNHEREYSWKKERKLTKFHTLGKLTEVETNVIRPGHVQAIDFQDKFIHQSHHHADLTVNLCFRTPDVPGKNLSNFLFSGLKIEKESESLRRAEVLYAFSRIGDVKLRELKLKDEDLLNFLLHTIGTSENPRLLAIQKELLKKVKNEMGIDVARLLREHDKALDEIQLSYQ